MDDDSEIRQRIEQALAEDISLLNEFNTSDFVDYIEEEPGSAEKIIGLLEPHRAVKTIKFLDVKIQKRLIHTLPPDVVASLIQNMHFDDRTALLSELTPEVVKQLVLHLSHDDRMETLSLLGYPEDSVGRLMNPDYIEVQVTDTVEDALSAIRSFGREIENINFIYVVDKQEKFLDDINIKELLIVDLSTKISTLMDSKFISLNVNDDREYASSMFKRSNRAVLPVVDNSGVLMGIVTIDDILRVESEEATEDIHKLGGTKALDTAYISASLSNLIKSRLPWLLVLYLGEMLTIHVMNYFKIEIEHSIFIAFFIPLLISSGGNTGSQASFLIIRDLALDDITFDDWFKVFIKELSSGLILGLVLAIVGTSCILIWQNIYPIFGDNYLMLALTVGLSTLCVVVWGTLCGAMLPLILKKIGLDPATSSAPFIATLVDVTGLIIYFTIAYNLLMR